MKSAPQLCGGGFYEGFWEGTEVLLGCKRLGFWRSDAVFGYCQHEFRRRSAGSHAFGAQPSRPRRSEETELLAAVRPFVQRQSPQKRLWRLFTRMQRKGEICHVYAEQRESAARASSRSSIRLRYLEPIFQRRNRVCRKHS